MRSEGTAQRGAGSWGGRREGGTRGGVGGGKRSLGSTGVKSRHQTQAALPPSFDPSPPLIQTTLPHFSLSPSRALPLPPGFSSSSSANLPRCPPLSPIQTSAALLPSLPSSRKGREGWVVVGRVGGQPPPRDVRLSRTHHSSASDISAGAEQACEGGFTTALRRINSAG